MGNECIYILFTYYIYIYIYLYIYIHTHIYIYTSHIYIYLYPRDFHRNIYVDSLIYLRVIKPGLLGSPLSSMSFPYT